MQVADIIDLTYEFLDTIDWEHYNDIIFDEDGDLQLYGILVDSCIGVLITPGRVVDQLTADELQSLSNGCLYVTSKDTDEGLVIALVTPKGKIIL